MKNFFCNLYLFSKKSESNKLEHTQTYNNTLELSGPPGSSLNGACTCPAKILVIVICYGSVTITSEEVQCQNEHSVGEVYTVCSALYIQGEEV